MAASLTFACASDPTIIARRLPLPAAPILPSINLPLCQSQQTECVARGTAKDMVVRDALLKGTIKEMSETIKSTWPTE